MNWKGCERRRSWPTVSICHSLQSTSGEPHLQHAGFGAGPKGGHKVCSEGRNSPATACSGSGISTANGTRAKRIISKFRDGHVSLRTFVKIKHASRPRWLCGVRRRSAADGGRDVCILWLQCIVGSGLCDGLIPRPDESHFLNSRLTMLLASLYVFVVGSNAG